MNSDLERAISTLESLLSGLKRSKCIVDSVCDDYSELLEKWPRIDDRKKQEMARKEKEKERRKEEEEERKIEEAIQMAQKARNDPFGRKKQPTTTASSTSISAPAPTTSTAPSSPWAGLHMSEQPKYRAIPSIAPPLDRVLSRKHKPREDFLLYFRHYEGTDIPTPARDDTAQRLALWQTYRALIDLLPDCNRNASNDNANVVAVFREWYLLNRLVQANSSLEKQRERLESDALRISEYRNQCLSALIERVPDVGVRVRTPSASASSGWWFDEGEAKEQDDMRRVHEGHQAVSYRDVSELVQLQSLRNNIQSTLCTRYIVKHLHGLVQSLSDMEEKEEDQDNGEKEHFVTIFRLIHTLLVRNGLFPCSIVDLSFNPSE